MGYYEQGLIVGAEDRGGSGSVAARAMEGYAAGRAKEWFASRPENTWCIVRIEMDGKTATITGYADETAATQAYGDAADAESASTRKNYRYVGLYRRGEDEAQESFGESIYTIPVVVPVRYETTPQQRGTVYGWLVAGGLGFLAMLGLSKRKRGA